MPVEALSHTSPPDDRSDIDFDDLLRQLDEHVNAFKPSPVERFSFNLAGFPFEMRRIAHLESHQFVISATLGKLPFSIEAPERRHALKMIVAGARNLPYARFAIDNIGTLTIGAIYDAVPTVAPDRFVYPLMLFLQETRPFISLIRRYL